MSQHARRDLAMPGLAIGDDADKTSIALLRTFAHDLSLAKAESSRLSTATMSAQPMKKVLIYGGKTGYIGGKLYELCKEQGKKSVVKRRAMKRKEKSSQLLRRYRSRLC